MSMYGENVRRVSTQSRLLDKAEEYIHSLTDDELDKISLKLQKGYTISIKLKIKEVK